MKKYTIKEFAEGKKAVKIENEEQWNKLDKVHKLTSRYFPYSPYYLNNKEHSASAWYLNNNDWEILEFSQLDFEDEFVVGKWYKCLCNDNFYCYKRSEDGDFASSSVISPRGTDGFTKGYNDRGRDSHHISYFQPDNIASLEEIQQYLPPNHPDFIKKDTFVLPKKWKVLITDESKETLEKHRLTLPKQTSDVHSILCDNAHGKFYLSTDEEYSDYQFWGKSRIENYTEITFKQFKTHILKEKTMEKGIIEYKLKFAKYIKAANTITGTNTDYTKNGFIPDSVAYKKHKEAGVLDLWFEPVYAPEYKAGDWVFVKYNNGNGVDISGLVSQLYKNDPNNGATGKLYGESDICVKQRKGLLRIKFSDIVRFATEEEVKKASISLPKINGKQCVDNGDKTITCGCTTKSFDWILGVEYAMGDYIDISGTGVSEKEIKQIVEYINNNK
jgi:hypothetical protein